MVCLLAKISLVIWCSIHLVIFSHAARILGVFYFESKSHYNFHDAMMKSLLAAGHRVTIITPVLSYQPVVENFTIINSKKKLDLDGENPFKSLARPDMSWFSSMMVGMDMLENECLHIMSLKEVENIEQFDVMFVEMMVLYQCFLPIAKKLGIPVIGTFSGRSFVNVDYSVGNPRNPSVLPAEFHFANLKMSFYDRLINLFFEIQIIVARFIEERRVKRICEHFLPGGNSENYEISLVFVHNHASLQPRAIVPKMVNVGGLEIKSQKLNSLPENFMKFIEEAEHGVILFSLGSIASSDAGNPHITNILKNTFAKVPQRVIWKSDVTLEGLSENILLSKWMPQKEILAHKNVKAFITHCGLSSTYEAIYFGKPLILLPMFADQPSNAALLQNRGVGIYLDILKLTEEILLQAINEVVNNTMYRENMEKLSQIFKDEPKSPAELVVFWTEYVLRHGGAKSLRSVAVDMPWYQYLLLDIITFSLIIVIVVTYVIYFCVKRSVSILLLIINFIKIRSQVSEKKKL